MLDIKSCCWIISELDWLNPDNKYVIEFILLVVLNSDENLGYCLKLSFICNWVISVVSTFSGFNNFGLISLKCFLLM